MIPSRQNAFEYKKTVCFMLMQAKGGNKTKCPPALSTCKDTIGFVNCFVSNRRDRSYPIARPRPRFLRKRTRNEVSGRVTGRPRTLFDITLEYQFFNHHICCLRSWRNCFCACESLAELFCRVWEVWRWGREGRGTRFFSEIVVKL